jgi:hypothetical protein
MAPLPTIGNCVRVAIEYNASAGVKPVNVLHLITNSEDEVAIGAALDDAFDDATDNPFTIVMANFSPETYLITLLDGSSAGQRINANTTRAGAGGGNLIPSVAGVLSLHTPQRGPRGRGRLYLGPVGEASQDAGILSTGERSSTLLGWQEVNDLLAASPVAASLGVASYVHAEVNGVTSMSIRPQYGSQRRRQNQLV